MLHFSRFLFLINFQRHMHSICVWNMIKQSKTLQTRYDWTYIYDKYYIRTRVYVFLFSVKKRMFELSRVWPWRWPRGGPHTWYLSAQSFITLLKLVWRGQDIVALNEWKKKCVGLQRTWVSKRTVIIFFFSGSKLIFKNRYRVLRISNLNWLFLFLINLSYSTHIWNAYIAGKQSKSLQTRYVTTYIYDRYYIRTHVYVFLFSVEKRVFELSWVWPWRWPRGGYPMHGIYRPRLSLDY